MVVIFAYDTIGRRGGRQGIVRDLDIERFHGGCWIIVDITPSMHGDTNGYKYDTDTDTNTDADTNTEMEITITIEMGLGRAQARLPAFSMTWARGGNICDHL